MRRAPSRREGNPRLQKSTITTTHRLVPIFPTTVQSIQPKVNAEVSSLRRAPSDRSFCSHPSRHGTYAPHAVVPAQPSFRIPPAKCPKASRSCPPSHRHALLGLRPGCSRCTEDCELKGTGKADFAHEQQPIHPASPSVSASLVAEIPSRDISCIHLFILRRRISSHPIGRHTRQFLDMQSNLAFSTPSTVPPVQRSRLSSNYGLYAPLGPLWASGIVVWYRYITPASCAHALTHLEYDYSSASNAKTKNIDHQPSKWCHTVSRYDVLKADLRKVRVSGTGGILNAVCTSRSSRITTDLGCWMLKDGVWLASVHHRDPHL